MGKDYSNYEEIATMPIVASLLGIQSVKKGASRKYPCPRCGHKAFEANDIKGKCFKCDFGGNYISYYAEACNISTKEAAKRIIKGTGGTFNYVSHEEPEEPMADIEIRHKAYTTLLSNLNLTKKHIADLKKRGLSEADIKRLSYKSFMLQSQKSRVEVTKKITNKNIPIIGVPGFFLNDDSKSSFNGHNILCWRKQGILVPYRDFNNRIQGFQVRKDDDKLEVDEDGKKENKYDWISSKGKKRGCGANGFVHFACDFYLDFYTQETKPILGDTIIITEGAMKADIAHTITGLPIIAVPGTKNLKELPIVLDLLKENHVKYVLNAFDMDYITNSNVKGDQKKLTKLIKEHSLKTSRLLWNSNYKGIDDFAKHVIDDKKHFELRIGIKYSKLVECCYTEELIKKSIHKYKAKRVPIKSASFVEN